MTKINYKEQIEKMSEDISKLDNEASSSNDKAFALRQAREDLIAKMIIEDGLLDNTSWELSVSSANQVIANTSMYLKFLSSSTDSMQIIEDLARRDYHSWFELEDGIKLQFDDTKISISFQDSKTVMPFVKKNKIILVASGVEKHLSKLKRDVAALEALCHQFKI